MWNTISYIQIYWKTSWSCCINKKQLLSISRPELSAISNQKVSPTSFIFWSSGPWASLVCLIFSTIFLINAWLLFSFLAINISSMNHRHLKEKCSIPHESKYKRNSVKKAHLRKWFSPAFTSIINLNQSNSEKTILLERWNEDEQKLKGSSVKYHKALKKHLYDFSQYFTEVAGIIMWLCNRVPQLIKIQFGIKLEIILKSDLTL